MSRAIRLFLLFLPTALISAYLFQHSREVKHQLHAVLSQSGVVFSGNSMLLGPQAKPGTVPVVLHPLEEFDYLSIETVLARRAQYVNEHADFLSGSYKPREEVFGMLEDKKPWWGINGIYYFGPGQKGPDGLSEETRFMVNPYLLVGLIESSAYIVRPPSKVLADRFPLPSDLEISPTERRGRVRYNVSRFFDYLKSIKSDDAESRTLNLVAYNARDLGFNFLWVDAQNSPGAYWFGDPKKAEPQIQFLHTGPSCGYPGGCNNMSPEVRGMHLSLSMLPAKISLKLWQKEPKDVSADPDFLFIVEVTDANGNFDLTKQKSVDTANRNGAAPIP